MMNNINRVLFVCSFFISIHLVTGNTCPPGYSERDVDICYKVYTNDVTQATAKDTCIRDGGYLVTIRDAEDNAFYTDRIDSLTDGAWIGAELEDRDQPTWRYIDGSYIEDQGCYTYRIGDTSFTDVNTSSSFSSSIMTRNRCINYCKNNGYSFAGLIAGDNCMCAYDLIRDKHLSRPDDTGSGCTTACAGNSSEKCGGYGFTNVINITGESPRFDLWAYDNPNDYDGFQLCAAIDTYNKNKLNDQECWKKFFYICQDASGTLYLESGANLTWFEARMECRQTYGGDLAVFDDAQWSSVINKTYPHHPSYYHVGLRSQAVKSQDGNELFYTDYASGEPDGRRNRNEATSRDTRCTYLKNNPTGGTWYDDKCNNDQSTRGYICQTSAQTTTTSTTTTSATTSSATTTTVTISSSSATVRSDSTTTVSVAATPARTTIAPTDASSTTATRTAAASQTTLSLTTTATTTPAPATPAPDTPAPATPAPVTPAPATPGPVVTTLTPGAANTDSITLGGGNAGGSTGNNNTLSWELILLIVICVVLFILIIILIVLVCYYKRKNNRKNRVGMYDGRGTAPIPYSGSIGDEVYLPPSDASSTGSQTNLLRDKKSNDTTALSFEPSPRPTNVTADRRY